MPEDYIEKVSDSGIIIRVNINKGSYMIFKENKPLINNRSNKNSIVHEIPQVIFLGKEFDLKVVYPERIGFFDVNSNQIFVPFWIKGASDVRHVKLPAYVTSDILPAFVYHFPTFHFGSIPASITGMNYFIVESRTDREVLIRLKMHFPMSRVVVYRGERDTLFDSTASGVDMIQNTRAADITDAGDAGMLSRNPVFAARVYLRKLDFEKLERLPFQFILDSVVVETILAYLNIMKNKAPGKQDLYINLSKIESYISIYQNLISFMSFDVAEVESYFDKGIPEQQTLQSIKNILKAQTSLHNVQSDLKKERFFSNVISMIDPLIEE